MIFSNILYYDIIYSFISNMTEFETKIQELEIELKKTNIELKKTKNELKEKEDIINNFNEKTNLEDDVVNLIKEEVTKQISENELKIYKDMNKGFSNVYHTMTMMTQLNQLALLLVH